ncbi:MAG: hypothetical protein OER95_18630, partial [Acidimicrobiia bacterium]|nr:hypothetical protein [Acidimicrobiia bacterium]
MTTARPTEEMAAGLDQAGADLARLHALSDQKPRLIPSLRDLGAIQPWLSEAAAALSADRSEVAAEWIVDNAYLVDRAVTQTIEDMPRGRYRQLPALAVDNTWCPPRVYAIAHGLLDATHIQLTVRSITRFVSGYQQADVLELAELWALPTMLRLACVETLVEAAVRLSPQLEAPFPLTTKPDVSLELDETERVARSIRCLATLATMSWTSFVETTSVIDEILLDDPSSTYGRLDPETRNRYRRTVEDLARRSHHSEQEVARRVLARARQARPGSRAGHVGYWLMAEGCRPLERSLRYRPSLDDRSRNLVRRYPTFVYLGTLLVLTVCLALFPVLMLVPPGTSWFVTAAVVGIAALPASNPALTILNWLISTLLPPAVLPKLDFDLGIPS